MKKEAKPKSSNSRLSFKQLESSLRTSWHFYFFFFLVVSIGLALHYRYLKQTGHQFLLPLFASAWLFYALHLIMSNQVARKEFTRFAQRWKKQIIVPDLLRALLICFGIAYTVICFLII